MKNRALFVLTMMTAVAGPAWAIRPEQPLTSVHSVHMRGIVVAPPGIGMRMDTVGPLRVKGGVKIAAAPNKSRAWQQFVAQTGPGWSVQWNPVTGTPHLVTGRPLALAGVRRLTSRNIEAACLDFVAAHKDLLKVELGQLRLANGVRAGGRWYVGFQQIHKGVPVLGGRLNMSFTGDDHLIMFGSDVYPDVAVETMPRVDQKEVMRLSRADCGETSGKDRIGDAQLCILPLRRPNGLDYLLCWRLHIFQPAIHKKWQYLVDANTGQIIGKSNVLVYENVTGTVWGEYKPEFAGDATEVAAFPYESVNTHGPEVVIASWDFDSDPCWTAEGLWAFGTPTGGGSFCGDPNAGYTGSNVYGYNLSGDYDNNMPTYYLTTTSVDCSRYENVHLKFRRWLGIESSHWDRAAIQVSNDASNWATIWTNPKGSVCDARWIRVSYDISAVARLQPKVYVRWSMGPTDSYLTFPGWNIDDVKVVSILGDSNTAQTRVDGSYSIPVPTNPCVVGAELEGLYCNVDYACGPDALFEEPNVQPNDVVDITWDSSWYNEVVESSMYWHMNYAHDYFTAIDPNLSDSSAGFPSGLDYPIPVKVQLHCLEGFCSAYWDGRGMAFGAGDGLSCDDFGLYAEVVYHEYAHAVTSKIYDGVYAPYVMESGAMNEAWSDYFGCVLSPSQGPLVGDGGLLFDYPDGLRTLDNTYRRETDSFSSVHFDSQMLSGALWEVRQVFHQQVSAGAWDQMVHFARYAHPQTFEEYLLAVLVEDDTRYGDSHLGNGTPHAEAIYTAFGNHGIGGLQYVSASMVIDDSGGNADAKLDPGETAKLSLLLTNGWADATDISATLASADPFVTVTKAEAEFPDIEHGGFTGNSADSFVVSLDPACPETHTINFTLHIAADGPYNYSRTCLFTCAVAVGQLVYDDGQVDNAYIGFGTPGSGLAARMTPQFYPCYPMRVRLFPYPGEETVAVTVTLWDDDGDGGLPGTALGGVQADVAPAGDWFDVDISSLGLSIDSGSFYVGWIEGDTKYYNGMDMDPPYYERSWAYFPWWVEKWLPLENMGFLANLMVRVRYFYTTADGPVENLTAGRRYDYIQYAIYDANDGDEIAVGEGEYNENIDFRGKSLTVRSVDPENQAVVAATIINGGGRGPAVAFSSGEDQSCLLRGLTITGGSKSDEHKGGISCVDLGRAGPRIRDCVIAGNRGPGVYCNNSSPNIIGCTIAGNENDGIELRSRSYPTITKCIVTGNLRHGISGGYSTISNCTIVRNAHSGVAHSTPVISNCIVSDNLDSEIKGSCEATYSDIKGGWPGLGNISLDPCFVDPNSNDYHLKSEGWRWDSDANQWTWDDVTSRCIDAGNPGSVLGDEAVTLEVDPLNRFGRNIRINMGAYGGTAEASMPPYDWTILADLTNDGTVDFVDFATWVIYWLSTGSERAGDLDRSGVVNMVDFALLAADFFLETSWHAP